MRKILLYLLFTLLTSIAYSQVIVKPGETRIAVNKQGDTLLIMNIADARTILSDLLDKQVVDSIVNYYQQKDSINSYAIAIQKKQIENLQQQSLNQDLQIIALEDMIKVHEAEKKELNTTIKKQSKEIKKQKNIKTAAIIAAIVGPLAVFLSK